MTRAAAVTETRAAAVLAEYERALAGAPLAAHTSRAYRSRVATYLRWLQTVDAPEDPLGTPAGRDHAVRAYQQWLRTRQAQPTTVNAVLTALDHFYRQLRLGPAATGREELPASVRRALPPEAQQQFLATADAHGSPRDRAIAYTLLLTGVRVAELVALDLPDIQLADGGRLVVGRPGSPGHREVPVGRPGQPVLRAWLVERPRWSGSDDSGAVFLNRRGGRLSTRSVDELIARLGRLAGVADAAHPLTPQGLRRTFGAGLLATGADLAVVAARLGHRRLDTTRRLLADV
ncbi:tyrosine-type recombinase/integrase [Natronosporangium hydrolyticum]|uniref:Tyrosine-type recombinase/integrase n=1 Tax=Natronosporangium hydrolyticum TaxID=2811111 RepID=A0A895YQI0_9ACTN|nr:tyrosine-type recombinase/integrase [Natronosporangium hydrolyticum]QSB16248.1 tyrosine-type recombinase/integrase [Natronosporangium hydrolyticum]